jgi:hypothetical protein
MMERPVNQHDPPQLGLLRRAMQHIVIAGTGRSGTTWVSDVLGSCRRCYVIYEPLRASMVPGVPDGIQGGDHPAVYLRPEDDDRGDWECFFRNLFGGKISTCWTRQEWRSDGPFAGWQGALRYRIRQGLARHCVIKCIRANMVLGWLGRRFSVRVIYLTRHPCAVVGSRLKLKWEDVLETVLAQGGLYEDYLRPHQAMIAAARTPLQRMTVHWCVENLVPLTQLARNPNWMTLSYEECVASPREVFGGLVEALGLARSPRTEERMRATAESGRPWHHPLSEAEGGEVLDICGRFGIGLYGRQPMPMCDARAALTGAPVG